MSALQRTPLYDAHVAANARLVDFGGWEMPLHYGSQIEEHHAVRQNVGMFDVSHMRSVDISGPQSRAFLRYLLANDVNKLKQTGRALYSCMLNPQGGIIDDLIAYHFAEEQWRLVVNAACAQADIAWMKRVASAKSFEVVIAERPDLAMLALQGPQAMKVLGETRAPWAAAVAEVKPFTAVTFGDVVVARTGYTGEDGVEIMLPADQVVDLWNDLLAAGVAPCGLGARDTLRLEAGMNLYGQDMDALTIPAQAGLSWTVALADEARDFVGRAAITQFPASGQMLGLKLQEKGVMRAHMTVQTASGDGEITSGTMSPTLGISIAMARLPDGVLVGEDVHVNIRGKSVPAKVCQLPFVRHGKAVEPKS
ncbi:glycine cleavage system aminomethyltransferase GcvT [Orrella daihaiensis]|uniref:Aminomethyltransferase n=1 Tax=Orrella daihaiensis TaxID=2782176 RepID=A0ABY4AP04_9BURK|nr:glycine cleavage system aminomethyltransferase GcvT [Orrella daihaiensis]UOD50767.1 glycine cleavage system aminomethyltransferase GcvT [Orrella daihaiensis]